jgi:homeobox protein cut-like
LESQIAELEAECEGLSQSLEAQKVRTTEMEAVGVKRAKELTKEVQKKVKIITTPVELKFHLL